MTISNSTGVLNELPELKSLQDIKILKRSEGGNIIKLSFVFENATIELSGDYNIRSAIRCSKEFTGIDISILRRNAAPLTNMNSILSSFFSLEKSKDKFIFYGGGYGHGVGMSQYGARDLGEKGKGYMDILNMFYKDIVISQIY